MVATWNKYKRQRLGLCIDCKSNAVPGRLRCAEHLYKQQVYSKAYRKKNKEKILEYAKKIKQQRIKEGRCRDCGNVLDNPNKRTCQNCIERVCYEI